MLNGLAMANFIKSIHEELVEQKIPEYLGTRIFYSKFIRNPTYLLVGLNPGQDVFEEYENHHGQKMCNLGEFDDKKDFDYWQAGSPLIQSLKGIFITAGKGQDLDKIMITNCNFQGTKGTGNFYKVIPKINLVCRLMYNDTPYTSMQSKFFNELITDINPKYIIFLGNALDFYEDQLSPTKPLKDIPSKYNIREVNLNINKLQPITAVKFPRDIHGVVNKHRDDVIQWLTDH